MTEQNAPKGEPYGLAMACLHDCSTPPGSVVIHPDYVLWPCSSEGLSPEAFQLLEQASAILTALRARQIPVALVVPASSAALVHKCLSQANLTAQFATVVEVETDLQQLQQQQRQQQQRLPSGRSGQWAAAANSLKAKLGTPWQQMLFFTADDAAAREANRLGMAAAKVPAAGLNVTTLRMGLEVYSSKLESDRGY